MKERLEKIQAAFKGHLSRATNMAEFYRIDFSIFDSDIYSLFVSFIIIGI